MDHLFQYVVCENDLVLLPLTDYLTSNENPSKVVKKSVVTVAVQNITIGK